MGRFSLLCAGALLLCAPSFADDATVGDIDIFFSMSDTLEFKQPEAPNITVVGQSPAGQEIVRTYLWANLDLYDYSTWLIGLGLVTSDNAEIVGGGFYNPNMGDTEGKGGWQAYHKYRWSSGAVAEPQPGTPPDDFVPIRDDYFEHPDVYGVGLPGSNWTWNWGLGAFPADGDFAVTQGDTLAYSHFEDGSNTWTGSYLLGYVDLAVVQGTTATLNTVVSPLWTVRLGDFDGPYGTVRFGLNDPVSGRANWSGIDNPLADFTVTATPEPGTVSGVGLLLLLWRRRHRSPLAVAAKRDGPAAAEH